LTIEVPTTALAGIARMPGVISVSARRTPVNATATPSTGSALRGASGVTERVDAYDGSGVGVAVVDSGIAPSADFGDRITAFYDFTIGGAATVASDPYGHGTHVAGLVGGSGAMSEGMYRGMASGVSLIGLRVLDAQGSGRTSDVIAALEFATINKNALGIDVMNMSLGHPPLESAATDPLVAAVEQASAAGIIVVVSAGNIGLNPQTGLPGYGGITSPGDAPSAITVGAVDTAGTGDRSDDSIGPFSSRGPSWYDNAAKPDIVAAA
jgi:serine protease AprX